MTQSAASKGQWIAPASLQRMRTVSGFILFAYVLLHLINHSLGLISLELLTEAGDNFSRFIRFGPVSIILYAAVVVHVVSSLSRLYKRSLSGITVAEWVQIGLGLAIPFLLLVHIMGTRYAHERYGINDSYTYVLLSTFVFSTSAGVMNALGLVATWLHGCLGLYMWARLKPWYGRLSHEIGLVLATAIPVLALAGYWTAGQRIVPLSVDGEFMGAYYATLGLTDDSVWGKMGADIEMVRYGLFAGLGSLLIFRIIRYGTAPRKTRFAIDYIDGPIISVKEKDNLLEISKRNGVPHASVCGGRGRCSTCRVRVVSSAGELPPPDESERRVLARVDAADDVRLACQLNVDADLRVIRLLPSDAGIESTRLKEPWASGREKNITVMFADLRDFTSTAERRLPFDVVYLINQFSRAMGLSVEESGGRVDKFLGDGFMALFGVDTDPEEGARQSVQAAAKMLEQLATINDRLKDDLDEPLRMGIGIHTGSVILGNMGYGPSRGLTAIGDTVNTASRLEAETKVFKCNLCISAQTAQLAGLTLPESERKQVSLRGKRSRIDIYAIDQPDTVLKPVPS